MEFHFIKVYIFVYICIKISNGEECPNASGGCCNGYSRNVNTNSCIECNVGYYGKNCSKICLKGWYGRLCLHECNCGQNKSCDPIKGCVDNNSDIGNANNHAIKTETSTDLRTHNENATNKLVGPISDNDTTQTGNSDGNTALHLILYITITIVSVILIVCFFVFRQNYSRWFFLCKERHSVCLKRPFYPGKDNEDLHDEQIDIRNEQYSYAYNDHDEVYQEIRESQMVNYRDLVGGNLDPTNNRRISRSMNNLEASSVYNHLNHCNSTPNISGFSSNIYDRFNNADSSTYDSSRRNNASNYLYEITETEK